MNLIDLLDAFNWMDRVEGAVSSFLHADWKHAAQKGSAIGVVSEALRTAAGANTWTFRVPRSCGWAGSQIESLLARYSIVIWGRRVTSTHAILSVKERQANWAEYLILRRGIPLDGPLFNPDNARFAQKYAPGDRPPAWADRGSTARDAVDSLADWL